MPEGLRNVGPTFSRMIDGVFNKQKGKNLVAYVDDIVVKSDKKDTHIQDLQETFKNLRKSGLKLNLDKCIFGINKDKLLDCLVLARDIEANPKKIAAIVNMKPPTSRKQVQKLTNRLVALNRFISRSAEKGIPFFRTLRSSDHFE